MREGVDARRRNDPKSGLASPDFFCRILQTLAILEKVCEDLAAKQPILANIQQNLPLQLTTAYIRKIFFTECLQSISDNTCTKSS